MTNVIAVLLILGLLAFALRGSIKHFRGEGGCCGGTSSKPAKKKLKNKVVKTVTLQVGGMHCGNCANSVIRAINAIDGASAKVKLSSGTAVVSLDREVEEELLREAIRKAGYTVLS